MELTFRNSAGKTVRWEIQEIIAIDGQPYLGSGAELRDVFVSLATRVERLESDIQSLLREVPHGGN